MDDGSQKLLDVIDDPSALESFLGLSAAAAGENSSRTTLESLVDSLQQGLLDPNTGAGSGGNSARHSVAGTPHSAPTGSLVLTRHQLQQLQHFQAGSATGRPQGQALTFTLPPHCNSATVIPSSSSSSAATTVVTSSTCIPVSTHHFVLTPFHHTSGSNTAQNHAPHPITLISPPNQQGGGTLVNNSVSQPTTSYIYTPASSASPSLSTSCSISATGLHLGSPNIAIGHGGTILTSTTGLHVGGTISSSGMPVIGSTAGNPTMPGLASNSSTGGSIFGASILPTANPSTGGGVLVGPSGTTVFAPALATNAVSSPDSPFSVPTKSPAPHAPPTPSPSPLPLRSPASVPSHHPPSPAPSPYHTQLQSPQQQQQQQQHGSAANPPYILSAGSSQARPTSILKEHYSSVQSHGISSSLTPTSFVLSTASSALKDVYSLQQSSSQPSVVVLPQQRSNVSGTSTNTSPSPAQSPYSNLQSPLSQQNSTVLNQHLIQHIGSNSNAPTRSPALGGTQSTGSITPGGALTPAPSPSPQSRTAASPVIQSTTPQPTVIHQTIPAGLALSGAGQFPVMPPGSNTMLQGNHQLVQIIHHQTAAPQTTTFPAHTQIITTAGPGGTVPLQQTGTTVGGPPKPKQPPQILPKPPSGQSSSSTHTKIATTARATTNTQHQGLHSQHHTTASAAQVVIGQANTTGMIPTAQTGTILVNQVLPGLASGGPVLVQPNPSGGVQLILRSPTPGSQATASAHSSQHNQQQQQGKSPTSHQQPMFISGTATAQLVHSAGRQQMQQVLRLITTQGPMQLQQIQTPSGPTLIAVPSGQTLSFQQLGPQAPQSSTTVPSQQPQLPPQPLHGLRPSTPQQQQSAGLQQSNSSIIPTVQLHQGNVRPSLNIGIPTSGSGCTSQQNVSAVIGGHTISLSPANSAASPLVQQNHHQPPVTGIVPQSQDVTPVQQSASFPIVRPNPSVLPAQQHQCTGTNTEQVSIMAASQKKRPKKKRNKKKDEEPKLDLANIMKLSGIGDDEDLAIYDSEEPQVAAPASHSPAPLEMNNQQSPASHSQSSQQQSQLIAQLRSPPQIPLQSASGGTSLRLAVEDGHVVLHQAPPVTQHSAANIFFQNITPTVGQQNHNIATAQNQLSALLASGTCGNSVTAGGAGGNNHVVLSQLLQQTSSGPPSHLISRSTNNSSTRVTDALSPIPQLSTSTNVLHPQPQERFTVLPQQNSKPGFLRDTSGSAELRNSGIGQISASITAKLDANLSNSAPTIFGIQTKSSSGTMNCSSTRDGFIQPGTNKVDSSTSTCPRISPSSSPGVILTSQENATNLLLAKPPHQHTCHQDLTLKTSHDSVQKQNSATTQTEIIHPGIQLGPKQQESVPFVSASKSGGDAGPTFLGLHPFPNIQGLVSTTGGATLPLVTAPVMTSGSGNFSGEQLLIAHHSGMSVLAAPHLIHCLQQAQNAATQGLINMHQLQLTPSAINKAIGQGLAFNTQTGTILIGGSPETFNATLNSQHKQTIVTAPNNTTATKLLSQQSSVLLQQLNTGTGTPSAVRRCSSDSNSSISIGSPPSGGGSVASGATTVIGLINQPVVSQSAPTISTGTGPKKNQQSIETQTISLGIPTSTNLLESFSHTHPNIVVSKLAQSTLTATQVGKKKKPKQPRNASKIIPVVSSVNLNIANRQCNTTGTTTDPVKSPLHERNFVKPNTTCQGIQHIARTSGNDASFYVSAAPFTLAQHSTRVSTISSSSTNNDGATNTVPPLTSITSVQNSTSNILCQVGSTATSTVTTMATLHSVVSKVAATNLGVQQITTEVSTGCGNNNLSTSISKSGMQHQCVASQTVSLQQSHGGIVPHLVPIPSGSSAMTSGSAQAAVGSIIQKVQTIQLTPQNQKQLKQVQMQMQTIQGKRILTPADHASMHKLIEDQQRILLTGKVVPTIPGQHALGLPLNPDTIPSSIDGKQKCQAEVEMSTANTYLANLLRQQPVVSHQNTQLPMHVRYQHQIGNQIIPLSPANLQQKPVLSSSVATTATTASPVTTRASISVQCGTHLSPVDGFIQQPVGLAAQTLPKLSVVQPMLQTSTLTATANSQTSKNSGVPSSCEKGTSPLQVQVGTQTATPSIETSSSCSTHVPVSTAGSSGNLSPGLVSSASCNSSTNKLSPVPGQQLFSPAKMQPIFVATATGDAKIQPSFSPTTSNKTCNLSAVMGCKMVAGSAKPQTIVAPVSPPSNTSSRSSPAMATVPSATSSSVVGGMSMSSSGKRPTVTTSPIRPSFCRSDLIEQQLKTDQSGACMPDTCTPFQSTSDACKRLIRYHVFNEQLLSQQDLEKADEFFEATARHLLDKFRQMMNKYRYLLLMDSMREVNTSELMMIDRMFVAEEQGLLEHLKEEERKAKEESLVPAERQQPSSPHPPGVLTTVKIESGLPTLSGTTGSSPCDGLREVRVVVRDVMKNESIKRELEEDRKFTVVKRERLDSSASNKESHQTYDEWEEIQKELAVYCGPNNNIPDGGNAGSSTYTPIKVEKEKTCLQQSEDSLHLPSVVDVKAKCEPLTFDVKDAELEKKVHHQSNIQDLQKLPASGSPGAKTRSNACGPRDEGGGLEEGGRTNCGEEIGGEKRKEFCDTNADGIMSVGHRKKRHKHSYSPQRNDNVDDENDDINAQVQCAINSILNLQRSEDGFDIRPNVTVPSSEIDEDESLDCVDTRQYPLTERTESAANSSKPCSVNELSRTRHKRNSASCKTVDQQVVNHHEDNGVGNTDTALDEAVRSILTS